MNQFPTLIDLKNSLTPGDAGIADVAEVLVRENEALQDIPWARSNQILSEVSYKRAAMPSAQVRMLNEGLESTVSKKVPHTDTCIEIASRSIVDMKELRIAPDANKYLMMEARPHIAVLGEDVVSSLFYGADPKGVLGFAYRYGKLTGTAPERDNIVNAGGTGSNLGSAFIVKWDADEVTGIYPKNSAAGIDRITTANELIPDNSGEKKLFRAHVTDFQWDFGLKVRDHRYVARVCNIDMDVIATTEAARQKLFEYLIIAKNKIYHVTQGRVVIYVSPDLYSMLEVAAFNKSNMSLGYKDIAADNRILTFSGIPIRRNDCQLKAETKVQ
jgi:hypothetical protein